MNIKHAKNSQHSNAFVDSHRGKRFKKEISAGFVVFRRTDEGVKFLLLYHGHNYWNFPKGKIESEEKSLAAAFRETKEEAGLNRQDLRIVNNFRVYQKFSFRRHFNRPGSPRLTKEQIMVRHGSPQEEEPQNIFKIVILYLAETRNTAIKISSEHQGYGWFLYSEAMKITIRYKGNQKILKQAYDLINSKLKNQNAK